MHRPCVYTLVSRSNPLFYIGVTSNIAARMMHARAGKGSVHCRRYNIRDSMPVLSPNGLPARAR